MKSIEVYFLWLIIYGFIGWACETLVCSVKSGKLVKRGFLSLPCCPVYGIGALLNAAICANFNNPVLTFVVGAVVSFILTFITSYSIEKISGIKICDRDGQKLLIGGHASAITALVFGAVSVVQVMFLHPVIEGFVSSIHPSLLRLIFVLLVALLMIDVVSSFISLRKIKENIESFQYYCKHELRKDMDNLEKAKQDAALRLLGSKTYKMSQAHKGLNDAVFDLAPKSKKK